MRDDGGDGTGGSALGSVGGDQHLHEHVVDVLAGDGLDQEDIGAADSLLITSVDLAIGKLLKSEAGKLDPQDVSDFLRERTVGRTGIHAHGLVDRPPFGGIVSWHLPLLLSTYLTLVVELVARVVARAPALYDALLGALESKRAIRDILGNGSAGACYGVGSDINGSHHHSIGTDEGSVANGGRIFMFAIVIACDRAGAHVHALAHGGVTDIGEVRNLGAAADGGLLDLHVRAGLRAVEHVSARAQIGARAAVDVVLEDGLDGDGLVDHAAVAHLGIGKAAIGAKLAVFAHMGAADQMRLRPHDSIATNGGVGADPCLRGIEECDALGHPTGIDAVACDGGEFGELGA